MDYESMLIIYFPDHSISVFYFIYIYIYFFFFGGGGEGARGKGDPFRKLTQALLRILSESRISPTRCSKMCGTTVLLARRTTLSYTPILAKDTNDFL